MHECGQNIPLEVLEIMQIKAKEEAEGPDRSIYPLNQDPVLFLCCKLQAQVVHR